MQPYKLFLTGVVFIWHLWSKDIRCQVHELQSRKQFKFLVMILKSGATCMHWSRCLTQGHLEMEVSMYLIALIGAACKAAVLFSPVGEASEVAHQCLAPHGMSSYPCHPCHPFSPSLDGGSCSKWCCLTSLFFFFFCSHACFRVYFGLSWWVSF